MNAAIRSRPCQSIKDGCEAVKRKSVKTQMHNETPKVTDGKRIARELRAFLTANYRALGSGMQQG